MSWGTDNGAGTGDQRLRAAIDENIALQNDIIMEYILQNDDRLSREWETIKPHTGL